MRNTKFTSFVVSSFLASVVVMTGVPTLAAAAGQAKFVFRGAVTGKTANSVTVHVTAASKSLKTAKGTDQILPIDGTTKITGGGKKISIDSLPMSSKVKVFGLADAESGKVTRVRWIKVLSSR